MYRIALTSVTFRAMSPNEVCRTANDSGVKFIEWGGDVHLPPCGDSGEIMTDMREYHLTALSYGSYYRLGSEDYAEWTNILDTAVAIGARTVRIWHIGKSSRDVTIEEYRKSVAEAVRLSDMAMDKGIIIALEFHGNTYNDCAESCIRFMTDVGRDNVRTYWQPLGRRRRDFDNLERVMPYIVGVHVFHWRDYNRRYPLKRGRRVWAKYIAALLASHSDMNFIMEFVRKDSAEQFAKDAIFLREMIESQADEEVL